MKAKLVLRAVKELVESTKFCHVLGLEGVFRVIYGTSGNLSSITSKYTVQRLKKSSFPKSNEFPFACHKKESIKCVRGRGNNWMSWKSNSGSIFLEKHWSITHKVEPSFRIPKNKPSSVERIRVQITDVVPFIYQNKAIFSFFPISSRNDETRSELSQLVKREMAHGLLMILFVSNCPQDKGTNVGRNEASHRNILGLISSHSQLKEMQSLC